MKPLPSTPEFKTLSRRVIGFEKPEQALRDPVRFMAYAMTYGTWEDKKILTEYYSGNEFREALDQAPPGIFDGRPWTYWNLKIGRYPSPPLPERKIR